MKPFKKSLNLLSVGNDSKTVKGKKVGVLTGIMYLAPADVSSFQVCPKASAGCKAACLYSAGRGKFNNVQTARINKTRWFFQERETFMERLVKNVQSLVTKANKQDLTPAVRLNGTSDIAWEKIKIVRDGTEHRNIMVAFPDIQFYDYTKIIGRKSAIALSNYHLTFSLAEDNDSDALHAIQTGYNVAVVMNVKRGDIKPPLWSGFPVINGDDTDVRFFDEKGGHIIALTAKGDAIKDTTGFVRTVNGGFKQSMELKIA